MQIYLSLLTSSPLNFEFIKLRPLHKISLNVVIKYAFIFLKIKNNKKSFKITVYFLKLPFTCLSIYTVHIS